MLTTEDLRRLGDFTRREIREAEEAMDDADVVRCRSMLGRINETIQRREAFRREIRSVLAEVEFGVAQMARTEQELEATLTDVEDFTRFAQGS